MFWKILILWQGPLSTITWMASYSRHKRKHLAQRILIWWSTEYREPMPCHSPPIPISGRYYWPPLPARNRTPPCGKQTTVWVTRRRDRWSVLQLRSPCVWYRCRLYYTRLCTRDMFVRMNDNEPRTLNPLDICVKDLRRGVACSMKQHSHL